MDPFIGQIIMFAGNFAPRGWAFCDGQLLPIAQNSALFSILGTTYGGDGRSTFALPDLRGRVPLHPGRGPGLSEVRLGDKGGAESVTLTEAQLPSHSHPMSAPVVKKGKGATAGILHVEGKNTSPVSPPLTAGPTGGGRAVPTRPPFAGVNYIIALQGVFPSRS
jgi:microcystin-dependent protein